jgi:hypothetical protein
MHETGLERERHRALVAEGLAAALTEAARRVSGYLQAELQRPDWEKKTCRQGLEAALAGRAAGAAGAAGHRGGRHPLRRVLRRAKALARAVEDLEWQAAGKQTRAGRR